MSLLHLEIWFRSCGRPQIYPNSVLTIELIKNVDVFESNCYESNCYYCLFVVARLDWSQVPLHIVRSHSAQLLAEKLTLSPVVILTRRLVSMPLRVPSQIQSTRWETHPILAIRPRMAQIGSGFSQQHTMKVSF